MAALTGLALSAAALAFASGGAQFSESRSQGRRARRSQGERERGQEDILKQERNRQRDAESRTASEAARRTARERQRRLSRRGQGRASTILTGPLGLTGSSDGGGKTLLGE